MSDSNDVTPQDTASDDAPVRMVKLSAIYARVADRKGIDTTKAAKLVRAKMRGNFPVMVELSPNIAEHKDHANDGNRWPSAITMDAAAFVLSSKSRSRDDDDDDAEAVVPDDIGD